MLLDSDFDIIDQVNDTLKFSGQRHIKFITNIYCSESTIAGTSCTEILYTAVANVVDDVNKLMYRVEVVFDPKEVICHTDTYHGHSYFLPATFNKQGNATGRSFRIKGRWFEIDILRTVVDRNRHYNPSTGNFETTSTYRIYPTSIRSMKQLSVESGVNYRLILKDTVEENTPHVEDPIINFDGHQQINFTTGVFVRTLTNNDVLTSNLLANARINDVPVTVSMENIEIKTIPASRWQPYTIYRPVLVNGRGNKKSVTIKNNIFDGQIVRTIVRSRNVWDDERKVTVVNHSYILVIGHDTLKKV